MTINEAMTNLRTLKNAIQTRKDLIKSELILRRRTKGERKVLNLGKQLSTIKRYQANVDKINKALAAKGLK